MSGVAQLAKALRDFAQDVSEQVAGVDQSDCAELIRVLARVIEGKSVDRAFGAPGDWGYGTPIGDGVFAMLKDPADDQSGLRWHYVDDELPDDGVRVLIACEGDDIEISPVDGYREDGRWFYDDMPEVEPREAKVYAWAHVPCVPPPKGGAS
jgi:hypothetical protein